MAGRVDPRTLDQWRYGRLPHPGRVSCRSRWNPEHVWGGSKLRLRSVWGWLSLSLSVGSSLSHDAFAPAQTPSPGRGPRGRGGALLPTA
jgi:hypothetical protein